MRILEIVVIAVILTAAAGVLFVRKSRKLNIAMLLAVLLVLALHGALDHFRIQMVPAYAAALGLITVLVSRLLKPEHAVRSRPFRKLTKSLQLILVLALSGIAVFLSWLLPVFTMPGPTGSYAIGTIARSLQMKPEKRR